MRYWAKEFVGSVAVSVAWAQVLMAGCPLLPGADTGARTDSQQDLRDVRNPRAVQTERGSKGISHAPAASSRFDMISGRAEKIILLFTFSFLRMAA